MSSVRSVTHRQLTLIVGLTLLLTVTAFAPRLWLMRGPVPGSYQWSRALSYLDQCAHPLRPDVELAMRWRLLPPAVAHGLMLPGCAPLVIPWIGVIALTAYVAVLFRRRVDDRDFVLGGTLLVATTSAVLVPVTWLGINDAWAWLALLAVAFGRGRWTVPLALLLGPWIDERFLIALPLAWLTRQADEGANGTRLRDLGWILPYLVIRGAITLATVHGGTAESAFVARQTAYLAHMAANLPFGWWMGLRAAWLPLAAVLVLAPAQLRPRWFVVLGLTLVAASVTATDVSRSIAMLLPVVLLGCFQFARQRPDLASRALLLAGLANLLIPAAHVVATEIDPIHPLPVELLRLWHAQ